MDFLKLEGARDATSHHQAGSIIEKLGEQVTDGGGMRQHMTNFVLCSAIALSQESSRTGNALKPVFSHFNAVVSLDFAKSGKCLPLVIYLARSKQAAALRMEAPALAQLQCAGLYSGLVLVVSFDSPGSVGATRQEIGRLLGALMSSCTAHDC